MTTLKKDVTILDDIDDNKTSDILTVDDIIDINNKDEVYTRIMDFTNDIKKRLELLQHLFQLDQNYVFEIISSLSGMYQLSGSKNIEMFLFKICSHTDMSVMVKIKAAKTLLLFEEFEEDIETDDDEEFVKIKKESNSLIKTRNFSRKKIGYKALDYACYDMKILPTPLRVDSVCMLMKSDEYEINADTYFREIINDDVIDCDFRYKCILDLSKKDIPKHNFFILNSCYDFLTHKTNWTMYRILAAQYFMQNSEKDDIRRNEIQNTVLSFAADQMLDYNIRADAADVLLRLGDKNSQQQGRKLIMELGRINGDVKTVFDNAQNVHNEEIEASVIDSLEFLSTLPNKNNTFEGVRSKILEYFNDAIKESSGISDEDFNADKQCKYCRQKNIHDDNKYCESLQCKKLYEREDNIKISLNRIDMDRALYSKFNSSLVWILIKVWVFIIGHEFENDMKIRLLQELEDMAGTCSSGFASRLINVLSGYSSVGVRISWEDQIIANFSGRLNAYARKITEKSSPFYNTKLDDVIELWLRDENNIKLYNKISSQLHRKKNHIIPIKEIIKKFLEEDSQIKSNVCVNDFYENVINEMMISPSKFGKRQNFLLFFRTHMLNIRDDLYQEFKEFISDSDFDLYIRKAIINYEGEN
jgi:hypothetical protein